MKNTGDGEQESISTNERFFFEYLGFQSFEVSTRSPRPINRIVINNFLNKQITH
jgi:hypothetical protein